MALELTRGETAVNGSSGRTELPTWFGRYQPKKTLVNNGMGGVCRALHAGWLKKRWPIAVAAVLPAMIGLWGCGARDNPREGQQVTEAGTDPAVSKKDFDRLSRESFDRLAVGMTLKEVAAIVGTDGQQATKAEHVTLSRSSPSCGRTWEKAIAAGRVWIWKPQQILAGFHDDPSGDSKVEVLLKKNYSDDVGYVQKPPHKWVANRDNFAKLKVGMTLAEVEEIIGSPPGGLIRSWLGLGELNPGWNEALEQGRVYTWCADQLIEDWIVAAFTEPLSASSKAEAFSYVRGHSGAEDNGTLSNTMANSPIGKWQEECPVTVGTTVKFRIVTREFRKDGYLIVRLSDTDQQVSGVWRQEDDRFFFSHPAIDNVVPAANDRWITVESRKAETDKTLGTGMVLSGKMEGGRRFLWRGQSNKAFW